MNKKHLAQCLICFFTTNTESRQAERGNIECLSVKRDLIFRPIQLKDVLGQHTSSELSV